MVWTRPPLPALLAGVLLSACGGDTPTVPAEPQVGFVVVSPARNSLVFAGERVQLVASAYDKQATRIPGQTFAWAVSDSSVVSVDAAGQVTARAAGRATVTASAGGVSGTASVTVNPDLAATRCVTCHAGWADHLATPFPGSSCPACHLDAFTNPSVFHYAPAAAHAEVARGFTLLGAHDLLPCEGCHDLASGAPRFAPESNTDCIACHRARFEAQHGATPGWPTTCLACHTMSSFTRAAFDHAAGSGGFALLGVHTQLACTTCHDAATWTPLYTPQSNTDCIACHRTTYEAQHGATPGWPTTCLSCHTTSSFQGATFDHDGRFFPIFSGEHAGRWGATGCSTCHSQAADYTVFSCFACHAHNRTDMDAEHRGRSGYVYDSKACVGCHPRP